MEAFARGEYSEVLPTGDDAAKLPLGSLNTSRVEDATLVGEIHVAHALTQLVRVDLLFLSVEKRQRLKSRAFFTNSRRSGIVFHDVLHCVW